MFENIATAPADPILGLTEQFKKDPRNDKINLGVGIYKNELGKTPILKCVKQAEAFLLAHETSKSYLSIEGTSEYGLAVQKLLFGEHASVIKQCRVKTAQAPGGTGALRLCAEFIRRQIGDVTIWLSNPTWVNHHGIFEAAGLKVATYQYYDKQNKCMDFTAMLDSLQKAKAKDVVLFHGCCHNPTGIDPSYEQWQILATLCNEKNLLPLFDFAYQGFAQGIEQDAQGLRLFTDQCQELLIANSFSKNFGLYNERVGACSLIAKTKQQAQAAFSQIKSIARVIYSNPPAHGAAIVTTILNDPDLRALWVQEVDDMRIRIQQMRELFVNTLKQQGVIDDFSFINKQNGMFSFSGLDTSQVTRLKEEFALYIVGSGRISVAGMTRENMLPLCQAIGVVLSKR